MFVIAQARGVLFTDMTAQIGAIRIIPAFLMGAALYRLGLNVTLSKTAAWAGVALATAWIAIAAALKASDLAIWPALAALIFCLGETAKSNPSNMLSVAPLVYLGEVSYALYMTHLPVDIAYFHGIERLGLGLEGPAIWALWAGVFPASLLAAVLAHHLVERPARSWMRSHDPFAKRPQPEPQHEPVL